MRKRRIGMLLALMLALVLSVGNAASVAVQAAVGEEDDVDGDDSDDGEDEASGDEDDDFVDDDTDLDTDGEDAGDDDFGDESEDGEDDSDNDADSGQTEDLEELIAALAALPDADSLAEEDYAEAYAAVLAVYDLAESLGIDLDAEDGVEGLDLSNLAALNALFASGTAAAEEGGEEEAAAADTTYAATVTTSDGTTTQYESLSAAISAARDGGTVALLKDVSLSGNGTYPYLLIKYDITLDLGGYALTIEYDSNYSTYYNYGYKYFFFIAGYSGCTGDLTVKNGTIKDKRSNNNTTYGWYTFYAQGAAGLTLEDVTVQAYQPNVQQASNTLIYAIASNTSACPVVNLKSGTTLEELSNTSSGAYYWVNGVILMGPYNSNYSSQNIGAGATLNIYDGAAINVSGYSISGNANYPDTTINIYGGTLTSTYDLAIYHPQVGTLNISGGTITAGDGYSAIEMRAGTLNLTGGTVKADVETNSFFTQNTGGGSTIYGAGIAISQHTTKQAISVNISGDSTSVTGYYALYEANIAGNDSDSIAKVSIHIENGTFTSTGTTYNNASVPAVYSQDCTGFICHGTFISQADTDVDSTYLSSSPHSGGTAVAITSDGKTYVHDLTAVDAVEATCTEVGNIAYAKCLYSTCGAIYTTSTETDEGGAAVTTYTAATAKDVIIPATGHDWDDGVVTTEATCTTEGVITYTCRNDSSHVYTETIPAMGHDWGDPVWTWTATDSGYSATATFTCGNDSSHVYTETASVTVSTSGSSTVYTAYVNGPDSEGYTASKTVTSSSSSSDSSSSDSTSSSSSSTSASETSAETAEVLGEERVVEETAETVETAEDEPAVLGVERSVDAVAATGDDSDILFWLILLLAAGAGMGGVLYTARKRQRI